MFILEVVGSGGIITEINYVGSLVSRHVKRQSRTIEWITCKFHMWNFSETLLVGLNDYIKAMCCL